MVIRVVVARKLRATAQEGQRVRRSLHADDVGAEHPLQDGRSPRAWQQSEYCGLGEGDVREMQDWRGGKPGAEQRRQWIQVVVLNQDCSSGCDVAIDSPRETSVGNKIAALLGEVSLGDGGGRAARRDQLVLEHPQHFVAYLAVIRVIHVGWHWNRHDMQARVSLVSCSGKQSRPVMLGVRRLRAAAEPGGVRSSRERFENADESARRATRPPGSVVPDEIVRTAVRHDHHAVIATLSSRTCCDLGSGGPFRQRHPAPLIMQARACTAIVVQALTLVADGATRPTCPIPRAAGTVLAIIQIFLREGYASCMENTLEALRRVMSSTVPRWQMLVNSVPSELLERPPRPGEWSAAQCLEHLLVTERHVFGVRLRHLLEGRAELIPYDPEAAREPGPERTTQDRLAALAEARQEHARMLAPLNAAALNCSSHHPEYGTTTLSMVLNTWAAHDLDHTIQAEQALMQVFIPHTGHWRWEFLAKDVEAQAAAQVSGAPV
jgi:hypothetical protein